MDGAAPPEDRLSSYGEDEEAPVRTRTHRGDDYEEVRRLIHSIGPIDSLDKADEAPLIERAKAGDKDAMETLIRAYLPMILKIASERGSPTIPLPDRVQDGILGLMDAVHRYHDPTGQIPLMAFAKWRVLMHVQCEERSYRERPSDPSEGPELEVEEPEFERIEGDPPPGSVGRILEVLGEQERQVLTAFYFDAGASPTAEQVAQSLGLDHEEVERLRRRALAAVRNLWVPGGGGSGAVGVPGSVGADDAPPPTRWEEQGYVTTVPIAEVKIGGRLRKDFGRLSDLAESIREIGLLNPITLTRDGWLAAGHRRLLACRDILHWKEIPVRYMPWASKEAPDAPDAPDALEEEASD